MRRTGADGIDLDDVWVNSAVHHHQAVSREPERHRRLPHGEGPLATGGVRYFLWAADPSVGSCISSILALSVTCTVDR